MKEKNRNKANDKAAIERRKQKRAMQQQHSTDKHIDQVFPDVPNKDTFGPAKFSHITGNGFRGDNRLSPLATNRTPI
ncbi:hypothetical protein EDC38_1389 [Marinimicrobium koreense]|uniref:Uncharacterized protein n=1 Tax=Marinimicrobium koreense TaxID=306545 RepID=A0A3N1NPJ0_9GAMM|nr:hypothetical protein [Marinimicrobium koreense]ROQ20772.1 hypothetical protein EDC38_1389 [Marinimicrobium koreense]